MNVLSIELRKEKRTGVIPVLLAVGVLGAAYAFVNFLVRKDTLLNLPLAPMDVLLTQLYGMIMVLNLFGIVVATCMIYNVEFKGSAVKKMYMLPVSVPAMYLCKFLILTVMFLVAIVLQNLALAQIGMTDLPDGAFEMGTLVSFAGYSFLTSMPVLHAISLSFPAPSAFVIRAERRRASDLRPFHYKIPHIPPASRSRVLHIIEKDPAQRLRPDTGHAYGCFTAMPHTSDAAMVVFSLFVRFFDTFFALLSCFFICK